LDRRAVHDSRQNYMRTEPRFRDYSPRQLLLLPPDLRQWLPEDHLVNFINDVVDQLDLSEIINDYDSSRGGQPAFHPVLMVKLLVYGYCTGVPSSRKIEKNTYETVPFRVLSTDQHPDHDTIAEFRNRHIKALGRLFVQVLRLCEKAGLIMLGTVALDGTKVKANASRHKAMSYDHMEQKAKELQDEVARLLALAQATDAAEDERYGKGKRGDELPRELRFRKQRLQKILKAKQALEAEAAESAQAQIGNQVTGAKDQANPASTDKTMPGRSEGSDSVSNGSAANQPKPTAQRNFTDPDSRIMPDGATKAFEQCYNGEVAVDRESQVILATSITQQTNDKLQVQPLIEGIKCNFSGRRPKRVLADNGFFSEDNADYLAGEGIDGYLATGRLKHDEIVPAAPRGRIPQGLSTKERMARKLRTIRGRMWYKLRKEIAEPVFGQIKEVRGFRRFLLRGMNKVPMEFDLICLTHNLLKLYRSGWTAARA
jgi:transposase